MDQKNPKAQVNKLGRGGEGVPRDINGNITCWYTNADTITNKMTELKHRIMEADNRPDIILITEIKPKNNRYTLTEQELMINSFNIHTTSLGNGDGRGTLIYTCKNLK